MQMGNIVAARADESTGCTIGRDLALLAAGLDTRFLRAGATLATAIEMIDRIIGGLDGIVTALDENTAGASVANMRSIAGQLSQLPDSQRDRAKRMNEVGGIARRLNEHVLDMHETLRVLSIYGMNIKIAASGEEQFVGFVDNMQVKLAAGEQHFAGFINHLKQLMGAVASAQQADRLLASESAKVVPDVPARLASDASELATHLVGITGLASNVARIARSVQAKVAIVLGALQVGDSTCQRLKHVVSALQIVEHHVEQAGGLRDQAAIGYIDRLLAAQIDAALADFSRETTAMLSSLGDLRPDTVKLLDLIVEHGDGGGREFLVRLDHGISDIERVTSRLREAEGRSRAMVGVIADTVESLSTRLASVQRIRVDVQDIAVNTRLLCRRHGMIGKAVSVVAIEVDDYTVKLGVATFGVSETISRLGDIGASLRDDRDEGDDRDMGNALADALSIIRRACQRSEEAMTEGGDNARQLIELLTCAGDDLSEEMAVKDVMEALSQRLEQRTPTAQDTDASHATLQTLLPLIAKLYTMASERDVHARFLLPGMHVAAVEPILADDDDGLF